jgi:hypothetical protein
MEKVLAFERLNGRVGAQAVHRGVRRFLSQGCRRRNLGDRITEAETQADEDSPGSFEVGSARS